MNINFELYRIFYVVANHSNITKASEELNISQPAISKSIKNLEDQLGGNLFIRTKRGVILTEEGKEFYNYIKQAMEYINNAEKKFTNLINLETGCIKIGINTTLTKEFLLPFLEEFHSLYPKIDIQIMTGLTTELISKLKNGLIDIVILNINNYPLILQKKGSNTRDFLDNIAKENNVILKPNIELASYSLVVEFSKIGLGIGYVTKKYIQKELKNKELYELNIKEKIPSRYIGIALSKNHLPSFSTKKLIEIIEKDKYNFK